MLAKIFLIQIIYLVTLINRFSTCQPITTEEEEDHLNNRLRHYLKRIELVAQKSNGKFSSELQNLIEKFKQSLQKETFEEKTQFLEKYTKDEDLAEYLSIEFDKQYINEDILIETWYLNEIIPHVTKDLYNEVEQIIHELKEAYRNDDFERKFNIYSDLGEKLSEGFLDYFYGENPPVPLLNAQLKYYQEYLIYLLQECQKGGEFKKEIKELLGKVEVSMTGDSKEEKETVIELFDDLTTKFGRYLDEHFVDFKMYKFGE